VTATVLLAGSPSAATAHVGGPPPSDAPYYQTLLTSITPRPAGVTAQVASSGDWIELTVTGPEEVIVSGYGGEPYLRITAGGVWQNDLSATGVLNESLFVDAAALTGTRATAAPTWRRTGPTGTVRWHDHRIHWMGVSRPPNVAADPIHRHLIGRWTIAARAGREPFTIDGTLNWIGKPRLFLGMPPRIALALTLGACVAALLTMAVLHTGRRRSPYPPSRTPARPAG